MFIPRFSTRSMIALTAVCAGVFLVLGLALEGHVWAGALSAVIVAACLIAVVHAGFFAFVWLLAEGFARFQPRRAVGESPFAGQAFPLSAPSLADRMRWGGHEPIAPAQVVEATVVPRPHDSNPPPADS